MATKFRNINYGRMLYETLRSYFSVNKQNKINELYKYCACLIQPLIAPFDLYAQERIINGLIANCYWQIGQLTNVLNYLYDSVENSIFITQGFQNQVNATGFAYLAIINAEGFGGTAIQMRGFFDRGDQADVIINVPNTVNIGQITATINQIILQGIPYQINIFIPSIS